MLLPGNIRYICASMPLRVILHTQTSADRIRSLWTVPKKQTSLLPGNNMLLKDMLQHFVIAPHSAPTSPDLPLTYCWPSIKTSTPSWQAFREFWDAVTKAGIMPSSDNTDCVFEKDQGWCSLDVMRTGCLWQMLHSLPSTELTYSTLPCQPAGSASASTVFGYFFHQSTTNNSIRPTVDQAHDWMQLMHWMKISHH